MEKLIKAVEEIGGEFVGEKGEDVEVARKYQFKEISDEFDMGNYIKLNCGLFNRTA